MLLKTNLPKETQEMINKILAISSGLRTASQTAFLASIAPYLTNRVEKYDEDGNILICAGETVPSDGESGFAKGCIFIKENATSGQRALYENIGTSTSCIFNVLNDITVSGTPINAVASRGSLTVTSGGTQISDAYTVTVDAKTYTFKTTLTPTEGEVLIGLSDTTALANLLAAINRTGTPDTDYSCAAVHPTVTAVSSNATTLIVAAKTKGTSGDLIASTKSGAEISWNGTTLGTTVAGMDGTIGQAGEIRYDSSYLYLTVSANTIADANWRRISLGSAY